MKAAPARITPGRPVWTAAALLVLTACGGSPAGDLTAGEPLVRGPVEAIDHRATASGIRVRAAAGSREMCGIAATADSLTRYFRRDRGGALAEAKAAEVSVGDTVEVYVIGPVAESCPVQGRASAIVLVSGAP